MVFLIFIENLNTRGKSIFVKAHLQSEKKFASSITNLVSGFVKEIYCSGKLISFAEDVTVLRIRLTIKVGQKNGKTMNILAIPKQRKKVLFQFAKIVTR